MSAKLRCDSCVNVAKLDEPQLKKRMISYIDLAGRGNNAEDTGLGKLDVVVEKLTKRTELPKIGSCCWL